MLGAETSAGADFGFSGALPPLTIKGAVSGAASVSSGASSFVAFSFAEVLAGAEFVEGLATLAAGFEVSLGAGSESVPAFEGELTAAVSIAAAGAAVWATGDWTDCEVAGALCVVVDGVAAVPALWPLDAQPKYAAATITTAAATPMKIFLFAPPVAGSADPPNVNVGAEPMVAVDCGAGDPAG